MLRNLDFISKVKWDFEGLSVEKNNAYTIKTCTVWGLCYVNVKAMWRMAWKAVTVEGNQKAIV